LAPASARAVRSPAMRFPVVRSVVLLAALVVAAPVHANLLLNGGGESDTGGTGFADVPPSSWSRTGGPTVASYSLFGVSFGSSDPGVGVRGNNLFAGGDGQAVSTMSQTVDVSGSSTAIDAGTEPYTFCGYLGGFSAQDDAVGATVTFEDNGSTVLGSSTIGPVLAADRGNATALCLAT